MSISGIDTRSAFRKRSNSRSYSSGSTSVIRRQYETIEPAAEPRPGPTAMPLSFAYLMKSQTIRKYAAKPMLTMTSSSMFNRSTASAGGGSP